MVCIMTDDRAETFLATRRYCPDCGRNEMAPVYFEFVNHSQTPEYVQWECEYCGQRGEEEGGNFRAVSHWSPS